MTAPRDKQMPALRGWPAGIDNLNEEQDLARDENGTPAALRDAENVDLDRHGKAKRREGYSRVVTASSAHSLWGDADFPFGLYVDNGTLRSLREDGSAFDLLAGVGNAPLSYALAAGQVYWTSEQASGRVTAAGDTFPWGIPMPGGAPALSAAASGALHAGRYQVTVTFLSAAGEESGAPEAAAVDVAEGGGIQLDAIPQPPDISMRVRVYATPANGDVFYFARDLAAGMTSVVIGQHQAGRPLETQFMDAMPRGHIVRRLNAHLYVAVGASLVHSPAMRYGLCDVAGTHLGFPQRLAMIEPVDSGGDAPGLFVASGARTYWLGGADPANFTRKIAHPHGVVPGTSLQVPAKVFGLEGDGNVAYWLADNGVGCLGRPGGGVVPLRENQAVGPAATAGASMYRDVNGLKQVVTALESATERGVAVGDSVDCVVVHHDQ
jgi:hypothetical protein